MADRLPSLARCSPSDRAGHSGQEGGGDKAGRRGHQQLPLSQRRALFISFMQRLIEACETGESGEGAGPPANVVESARGSNEEGLEAGKEDRQ